MPGSVNLLKTDRRRLGHVYCRDESVYKYYLSRYLPIGRLCILITHSQGFPEDKAFLTRSNISNTQLPASVSFHASTRYFVLTVFLHLRIFPP